MKNRPFKPTQRQRRALGPILGDPVPTYDEASNTATLRRDIASLRAAFTRFEKKHGPDALISFLKIDLQARGETRRHVDALAPHPGQNGQTSLLDSGR